MWYEPSRNRSIGYARRRRPHGATLMIWPPAAVIWRVMRSMTAWLLSSGDVGTDHEHEFVSAHARSYSFQWECPVDVGRADRHGAERKRTVV